MIFLSLYYHFINTVIIKTEFDFFSPKPHGAPYLLLSVCSRVNYSHNTFKEHLTHQTLTVHLVWCNK